MLKDIKLGFKLLRYGYKLKLNVIMFVFFAVIGIASDIMSKGTSIIGGVYFMMCGMFTFQLIMSMDVSELIQSTSLKKKLQIYIPVLSSTVINLVVFTFLVIERVILIQNSVADKKQLIFTLFTLDVVLLTVYLLPPLPVAVLPPAFLPEPQVALELHPPLVVLGILHPRFQ